MAMGGITEMAVSLAHYLTVSAILLVLVSGWAADRFDRLHARAGVRVPRTDLGAADGEVVVFVGIDVGERQRPALDAIGQRLAFDQLHRGRVQGDLAGGEDESARDGRERGVMEDEVQPPGGERLLGLAHLGALQVAHHRLHEVVVRTRFVGEPASLGVHGNQARLGAVQEKMGKKPWPTWAWHARHRLPEEVAGGVALEPGAGGSRRGPIRGRAP